jgi:hypothetical protein
MAHPVCFMVMPYNLRSLPNHGEVDYNALWDRAFEPLLQRLGYDPVRADEDLGASILADMLIRLTASDLVVADLSMGNPNVYYEIGVRHSARDAGCVLIAPDWAPSFFDLAQVRHLTYPLQAGPLTDEGVEAIREALQEPIRRTTEQSSPVYQLVPGFPQALPTTDSEKFRAFIGSLTEFQAGAAAVRAAPEESRPRMVEDLLTEFSPERPQSPAVMLELLGLVRDYLSFDRVLDVVSNLTESLARSPYVLEQQALALSKISHHVEAVALLEQLITNHGRTPERLGLLGGRCKKLWEQAKTAGQTFDARRYLTRAIESYSSGMWLDLNEYYCASNLPRLLRVRNGQGDADDASVAADVTRRSCERAEKVGKVDGWLAPTLLAAAFDAGDPDLAERLLVRAIDEGPAKWHLDSVLDDLRTSFSLLDHSAQRLRQGVCEPPRFCPRWQWKPPSRRWCRTRPPRNSARSGRTHHPPETLLGVAIGESRSYRHFWCRPNSGGAWCRPPLRRPTRTSTRLPSGPRRHRAGSGLSRSPHRWRWRAPIYPGPPHSDARLRTRCPGDSEPVWVPSAPARSCHHWRCRSLGRLSADKPGP